MECDPHVQVAAQVEQVEAARREARDLKEENSRWAIYRSRFKLSLLFETFPENYKKKLVTHF